MLSDLDLNYRIQQTLNSALVFEGVGLHSGALSQLIIRPAPANHGIRFVRTDLTDHPQILAHYDSVVSTELATSLGRLDRPEAKVSTVEHLMAALFALGITNALAEISGPEVPILDGSARPYVDAILRDGPALQPFTRSRLRVTKAIKIYHNGAVCELLPRKGLRLTTSVDFEHPAIGLQTVALELTPEMFAKEIGSARTFGFIEDLDRLRSANLALGASLENVVAFSKDSVLNPEGLRFVDECVRHKLLDAIGDLALCGHWIDGELVSFRGGHSIHLALLKSLNDFKAHWEFIPASALKTALASNNLETPADSVSVMV